MSSIQHIPSLSSAGHEQQQIEAKIKEVKHLQEELQHLNTAIPEAIAAYQKVVLPLAEKIRLLQKEKLIALDMYIHEVAFSKRERNTIDDYMQTEILHWIFQNGPDAELEELFRVYARMSFEEYNEQNGMNGDPFEWNEPPTQASSGIPPEKKSAAERSMEQHRKKSIRAIYIDLIKAFHPDMEQDQEKKKEKEEISKKITDAYSKNDLYMLLKLETEFLEQQHSRLQNMKSETVKSYAAMLDSQIKELKENLRSVKQSYAGMFIEMCKPNARPDKHLRRVKKELQEGIQILSRQIMILQHMDPGIKSDLLFEMERQNNKK